MIEAAFTQRGETEDSFSKDREIKKGRRGCEATLRFRQQNYLVRVRKNIMDCLKILT